MPVKGAGQGLERRFVRKRSRGGSGGTVCLKKEGFGPNPTLRPGNLKRQSLKKREFLRKDFFFVPLSRAFLIEGQGSPAVSLLGVGTESSEGADVVTTAQKKERRVPLKGSNLQSGRRAGRECREGKMGRSAVAKIISRG